ncbi:MAG: flavin reductase family protein [Candidatus Korobacteraceae bacterium]|jgi:flavin reductase (DIM6/NTAB) family NADH-FMN oxidoreductase RutF
MKLATRQIYKKVAVRDGLDAILLPRPVVVATCVDAKGKPNAITLAWCSPVSHRPLVVAIAISPKRYSHNLVANAGEFVLNFPSIDLAEEVNWMGRKSGSKYDKFAVTGVTLEPAKEVNAPVIRECYAHLECKVINQVAAGDHTTFFGQVVHAEVAEGSLQKVKQGGPPAYYFDPKMIKTLQHLGGDMYLTNTEEYVEFKVEGVIDV